MAQWSSEGVETLPSEPGSLVCSTTHLSIFGAVVEVLLTLGRMKAAGNEPKHEVNGRWDKFGAVCVSKQELSCFLFFGPICSSWNAGSSSVFCSQTVVQEERGGGAEVQHVFILDG